MDAVNLQGVWPNFAASVVAAVTGAGGSAPKKYWGPQKTNMRNAFMLDEASAARLRQVDAEERCKLVSALLLLDEED